jgi:hypothetical protein
MRRLFPLPFPARAGAVALALAGAAMPASAQESRPTPSSGTAAAASDSPVRFELAPFAGVMGTATSAYAGRYGDALGLVGAELRAGVGALDLDGNVHLLGTPSSLGTRTQYVGVLRLGYRGGPFAIRAGATLQYSPLESAGARQPADPQLLPSLHAGYSFGRFGLSAGLFDGLGYAPAHLSAHLDGYSLGFVAPLGLRAGASLPLGSALGLRVEGFAFSLFGRQTAMLTLSAVFGPGAGTLSERSAP